MRSPSKDSKKHRFGSKRHLLVITSGSRIFGQVFDQGFGEGKTRKYNVHFYSALRKKTLKTTKKTSKTSKTFSLRANFINGGELLY